MDQSVSEGSEVNVTSEEYKVSLERYKVKGIIHH